MQVLLNCKYSLLWVPNVLRAAGLAVEEVGPAHCRLPPPCWRRSTCGPSETAATLTYLKSGQPAGATYPPDQRRVDCNRHFLDLRRYGPRRIISVAGGTLQQSQWGGQTQ
jgi:hypothetical protein